MRKLLTITGELGSGKSTVSHKLADLWKARRYSAGDAQREIAASRNMTTLELNKLSEVDKSIDTEVDSVFSRLDALPEDLVVDSRMAWFFLPKSVKVRLSVSPQEAAKRVFSDENRKSETRLSVEDTFKNLQERRLSERRRFIKYYDADIDDDDNFDYVIDTTGVNPDAVVDLIDRLMKDIDHAKNKHWIPPHRLYPTKDFIDPSAKEIQDIRNLILNNGYDPYWPIDVIDSGHDYLIQNGHKRASAALLAHLSFVPARSKRGEVTANETLVNAWKTAHQKAVHA